MTAIRPRRSVLYLPGSNARALEKARDLPSDSLILDLEDAVAPEMKAQAREQVCAAVKEKQFGARETVVRINGHETEWAEGDLNAAIAAKPDAILLPKIDRAADLQPVEQRLSREADRSIALWIMIETPAAIFNLNEIADAGGRLAAFVFGGNDLLKAMHARPMPGRSSLAAALTLTVLAARTHGLFAIDGVFNDLQDSAGFVADCEQGRGFGFDGKTLIHPSQLADCNRIFAPSDDEIAHARAVIAAFDLPGNKDKGAIRLDGHMVERLHLEMARRTVTLADVIASADQRKK